MIITLAYCPQDQAQAVKLLDWMQELGPYPNHELLLFRERKACAINDARKGFGKFTEQVFDDPYRKWPISTTNAFATAARYLEHTSKQPFLWLEPDVVPMRKGWLDELANEYIRTPKKPFMGAMVPGIGGTPDHMSGVGIWPGEMTKYAGVALMLVEDAPFDITACETIYPQAHFTDLIQHSWDRPPKNLTGEQRMQQITSECVLFHGDKSGNLIEYLRNRESKPVAGPPRIQLPQEGERSGDLVFQHGAWRKEPIGATPIPSELRHEETGLSTLENLPVPEGFYLSKDKKVWIGNDWKEEILDGQNKGQPEKNDQTRSPGTAPLGPSKTLSFGSEELRQHLAMALKSDDQLAKMSPPWQDKKASEQEVRLLCESLALFCGAPIYKKRVRDALREVRIIK